MADPQAEVHTIVWPLPVSSARVQLRRLRESDLPAFQRYRNDPDVGRYQGWLPMDDAGACEFIRAMEGFDGPTRGDWIQLAIAEIGADHLIGDIGVHLAMDGRTAEIGFSCSPDHQGRGLASEAVAIVLGLLFRSADCEAVKAVVDARNAPSIRLLERLGFERADIVETVFRGEPCCEHVYVAVKRSPQ